MLTSENVFNSVEFERAATEIANVGRFLALKGWAPATSSNYSTRLSENFIAITRTGADKHELDPADVLVIHSDGSPLSSGPQLKSSAETLIHTTIYELCPNAGAVLHTHSPLNTRISLKFLKEGGLKFSGYEMQKGLVGRTTHEDTEFLPILPNSQDMSDFSRWVRDLLARHEHPCGFLIAGHGLYAWGKDLKEAQRIVETYEFLLSCLALELSGV